MNRTIFLAGIALMCCALQIEAAPKKETASKKGGDPGGHVEKADQLAHEGQFDAAIAEMNKAIEAKGSATNYNNRGNIYRAAQKLQEAIADYSKAIELDPKDGVAYFERGQTQIMLKQVRSCIG